MVTPKNFRDLPVAQSGIRLVSHQVGEHALRGISMEILDAGMVDQYERQVIHGAECA
jgi:hypothetical protein